MNETCGHCAHASEAPNREGPPNYLRCAFKSKWEYQAPSYPCDVGQFKRAVAGDEVPDGVSDVIPKMGMIVPKLGMFTRTYG